MRERDNIPFGLMNFWQCDNSPEKSGMWNKSDKWQYLNKN